MMRARGSRTGLALGLILLVALAAPIAAPAAGAGLNLEATVPFLGASEVEVQGSLAYVGSSSDGPDGGLWIIDIADPADPSVVGRFPCTGSPNSLAVRGSIVVMALNSSGGPGSCAPQDANGIRVIDVSDPADPQQVSFLSVPDYYKPLLPGPLGGLVFTIGPAIGDVTFVTDTILYLSPGGTRSRTIGLQNVLDPDPTKIVDISDPTNPVLVGTFAEIPGSGCADISVLGNRAYCADSETAQIWDVSDPIHPALVSTIFNPLINSVVSAVPSVDGKTLVIADEMDDIALCEPGGRLPVGALWFYDISSEKQPVPSGYLGPSNLLKVGAPQGDKEGECTSHTVSMIPGRNWVVVSWLIAGTSVVDFSDPSKPVTVGWNRPDNAAARSARFGNGAILTGDIRRGLDVFSMAGLPA